MLDNTIEPLPKYLDTINLLLINSKTTVNNRYQKLVWKLGATQTHYFTLGWDNLLVVTDHKPLTKLLGSHLLDDVSNNQLVQTSKKITLAISDCSHAWSCIDFIKNALSQPPKSLQHHSNLPYLADFFELDGHHYLVVADRLWGWPEISNSQSYV